MKNVDIRFGPRRGWRSWLARVGGMRNEALISRAGQIIGSESETLSIGTLADEIGTSRSLNIGTLLLGDCAVDT